jgi:hypothetical protein
MRIKRFYLSVCAGVLAIACNHTDVRPREQAGMDGIYFDYRVWSEEGQDDVVCMFEYKKGGPSGSTTIIRPSRLQVDGLEISPDSSRFGGSYYEFVRPVQSFTGWHTVIFTDNNNKEYREKFEFQPFSLEKEIPGVLDRKPYLIRLAGFPTKKTMVRLVIVDTSFSTNDVHELIPVTNGELTLTRQMLSGLRNGPQAIELYREDKRRMRETPLAGGRISVSYGLKRVFELSGQP